MALTPLVFTKSEQTPQPQPNKPLNQWQTFKRDFWDFILLEHFGYKGVAVETEQYIRQIIKQMDMKNYNIEIRSMSNFAKRLLDRMNTFVMPSLFVRSELNYLFVSEEWFNSLPEPEKRALISHEMIHIRNNHMSKTMLLFIIATYLSRYIKIILNKNKIKYEYKIENYGYFDKVCKPYSFSVIDIFCTTILSWFSRKQEKEADIEGAKTIKTADGAVQLWKRYIKEKEDPDSRFAFRRLLNKIIVRPCNHIYHVINGTHPTYRERKKYMKKLAKKLKRGAITAT